MRIYENPEKTSENRLAPISYYIPGGISEYTLLNGDWQFAFFSRDIDVPETITQWDTIPVPSCWQLYGYENPNYSNTNYPYPVDPPYVQDDNPCGVYQREFTVAAHETHTIRLRNGLFDLMPCHLQSVPGLRRRAEPGAANSQPGHPAQPGRSPAGRTGADPRCCGC